ncbi:hypothetical protein WI41_25055 [Burkholderia latens]|uniref:Uncharacterized protein n=1 Tax=Burkholderia latens TaxID=488446 RepID=A0AAP1G5Z8_9BURK|nr:hypothetical protein WI41_25055 [Burkholderia latens]
MNMKNLRPREIRHTGLYLIPPRERLDPLQLFLVLRLGTRLLLQFGDQLLPLRRVRPFTFVLDNQPGCNLHEPRIPATLCLRQRAQLIYRLLAIAFHEQGVVHLEHQRVELRTRSKVGNIGAARIIDPLPSRLKYRMRRIVGIRHRLEIDPLLREFPCHPPARVIEVAHPALDRLALCVHAVHVPPVHRVTGIGVWMRLADTPLRVTRQFSKRVHLNGVRLS